MSEPGPKWTSWTNDLFPVRTFSDQLWRWLGEGWNITVGFGTTGNGIPDEGLCTWISACIGVSGVLWNGSNSDVFQYTANHDAVWFSFRGAYHSIQRATKRSLVDDLKYSGRFNHRRVGTNHNGWVVQMIDGFAHHSTGQEEWEQNQYFLLCHNWPEKREMPIDPEHTPLVFTTSMVLREQFRIMAIFSLRSLN